MVIFQIFAALATIPLFFGITFLNTETLVQNGGLQIYALIYSAYFIVSGVAFLALKYIKIKNTALKQELFSSIEFMLYMSILALPAIALVHYFMVANAGGANLVLRAYGRVAFLYLVLALSISPLASFVKNKKLADMLISMRKILGILSFVLFMRHGFEYFSSEYAFAVKHQAVSYRQYIQQNLFTRPDAATGVIAGIFMFILGVTSNAFSIKVLTGSVRKKVQSLVYPAFLIASIHIAFSSRLDPFYVLLILWLVYIRTISYMNQKKTVQGGGEPTKFLCIPCGYIYDEALGDPDGGIAPGTKFADIPDSRVCPVCGATKASFEAYYDSSDSNAQPISINTPDSFMMSNVSNSVMLTKDVLELSLDIDMPLTILPGQYISVYLKDFDGEFTRSFSVTAYSGNTIKLGIKIKETGRGGRLLKTLKIGDTVKIKGVFGNFVLKDTSNNKIFIATGTGLSPVYNMIIHNEVPGENMLFWGVRAQEDLFYVEKLNSFTNLKTEFFLSQEETKEYHYGRVDLSGFKFPLDAEFYLCGNAPMVKEQQAALKARGYTNIYLEIF